MASSRWRAYISTFLAALGGAALSSLFWTAEVRHLKRREGHIHRVLVDLLLNTLSAGDAVTERHSRRVASLTDVLAAASGISGARHPTLRLAALLHDLGKIDDSFFHILHSYEPLSAEEREKINEHPIQSADILEPLEEIHPGLSKIVAAHHECWDGNGYPDGLSGERIPLEARLISVADVFDALTQPRKYREPLTPDEALREIEKGSGTRFDPAVIERLRQPEVIRQWREIAERGRREETITQEAERSEEASADPDR